MRFHEWIDRSPPASSLHYIDVFLLTRIHTEKEINFSPRAWGSYLMQKEGFIHRHHTDTHYDYNFYKTIPHHEEHCLAYNNFKGETPWYSNFLILILLDIILCGFIQRAMLDTKAVKVEYYLEKYIIR